MIPSPDRRSGEDVVPVGYRELLEDLTARVRSTAVRAARAANTEVIALYWSIGRDVLSRQELAGWGAGVIDRLAEDLRAAFPDQRGFSRRNLQYMRAMAAAWPAAWPAASVEEFVQQPVAHLPWGARTEAANTTIKQIKRTGRGYRNPANYRARILLNSTAQTAA